MIIAQHETCCYLSRWNRMPKHIKILKHPLSRKYFVADVCEFGSVAVSIIITGSTSLVYKSLPLCCINDNSGRLKMTQNLSFLQDLVKFYSTNSLGASFPGVDTSLKYPYKDAVPDARRARSISNPPTPQLNPPVSPVGVLPPISAAVDRFADVLFNFVAEYPDELSVDVSVLVLRCK